MVLLPAPAGPSIATTMFFCAIAADRALAKLVFNLAKPIRPLQYFAGFAAVRRPDDALALHHIQNSSCPAVAQSKAALQGRGRRLAQFQNDPHRVLVHGILLAIESLGIFQVLFG